MREILPPLRSLRMTRMGYMQISAPFFAYLACLLYLCTDQSPFLRAVGRRILLDYEAEARVPLGRVKGRLRTLSSTSESRKFMHRKKRNRSVRVDEVWLPQTHHYITL